MSYIKSNKKPNERERQDNTSTVATLERPKVKKPPLYRVILLNDDYTPMEFVVYVLQMFFGFDGDKAQQIMLAVHTHGKEFVVSLQKKLQKLKAHRLIILQKKMDTR